MKTQEINVDEDDLGIHYEDSDSDDNGNLDDDNLPALQCKLGDSDSDKEDESNDTHMASEINIYFHLMI